MSPAVSELGSELVKQLGEAGKHDLLARWMAEYLGELLSRARTSRGAERQELSAECANLIFRLWAHRHSLPDGARPLASFEPLFLALERLSQDRTRYSFLRGVPAPKKGSTAELTISALLALDRAASALILYFLAEVTAAIPEKDKRWLKLRAVMMESSWDTQIAITIVSHAETLVEKEARLRKAEIETVQRMLTQLSDFEKKSAVLRATLQSRLDALA